jgi:hypothetical protein
VLGAFGVFGVLGAFVGLLDCRVEGPDEPVPTLVLFLLSDPSTNRQLLV